MSDKLNLPKTKFNRELVAASVDPTMKSAEATSTKMYRVPVGAIKTIPGFNVRVESAEYIAHRDNIRDMIAANGFDQTKPLAGYVAKEDDENVIYVTDGHTRLAAVQEYNEAAEKADKITMLPVIVHSKEMSLTDLTVALHTANSGRPLTPYELGVVVKRLLAEDDADKKAIAGRLGVTPRYIDDVLLLANADSKVKQHVASGEVSSTLAISLLRKDSDTAAEKLDAAVKKTAGTGKKATKKHVGPKTRKVKASVVVTAGDDMKEIVKSVAAEVRKAIAAEEGDDEGVKLATVDGTIDIIVEVPVEEKAKPAKKTKTVIAEGKPKKAAKPKTEDKPKKAKPKKAAPKDDLGIAGAEPAEEDDEVVKMPPKVKSDEGDEEVDI